MRTFLDRAVRLFLLGMGGVVVAALCFRFLILPQWDGLPNFAHAGGMVDGAVYTNSLAALDASYERGFRFFEIDFVQTAEGHDVCGHDWDRFGAQPADLAAFLAERKSKTYPPCTLDELRTWFAQRPDSRLVSDAKTDPLRVNLLLYRMFGQRLIAQAYDYEQACVYAEAGISHIILMTYRLPFSARQLWSGLKTSCLSNVELSAVAMPADRVVFGQALLVKALMRVPVYAHTVNHCATARIMTLLGVDALYSDTLLQGAC